MNRHERRAQAKAGAKTGQPVQGAPALAVLHAAVLKHAIDGRFLEALATCQQALNLDSDNADTLHLMGMVNLEARQLEHAVEWTTRAVGKSRKPAYLATLGLALSNLARHDDALQAFDTALELGGDDAQLWWQKGSALIAASRAVEALAAFERTLKLDPRHADAAYKCGHLLHELGRSDEALAYLDRSAELQPRHAPTWHMRGVVLKQLDRLDEALADISRAVALDPESGDAVGDLGAVLQAQGRIAEALSAYERSLQLRPGVARMITNRGGALAELGRLDEAMAEYRRALAIDPAFVEAAWNLALLQLQLGDFEAGLRGREVRWKFAEASRPSYPNLAAPLWLGEEPLAGKTIVVCADEGFGDSIQYVRYMPMLAARGARVVLVVEAALCPLLSGVAGVSVCLPKHPSTVLPPFDFHCPITCLPLACGTRIDSIPARDSYLPRPATDRVQAFERRLGPRDRLRVGLVWSGNLRHQNDRNRSMRLEALSPLLDVDATFVSLQKDPRPHDLPTLRARPGIIDLTAELEDFAATAALVACLDLVISVDTSVAHLAGALGKPVWLLLPFIPDFRWLLGRSDSPWYSKHRLFVQGASRDYESVVDRVRGELSEKAEAFVRAQRAANPSW